MRDTEAYDMPLRRRTIDRRSSAYVVRRVVPGGRGAYNGFAVVGPVLVAFGVRQAGPTFVRTIVIGGIGGRGAARIMAHTLNVVAAAAGRECRAMADAGVDVPYVDAAERVVDAVRTARPKMVATESSAVRHAAEAGAAAEHLGVSLARTHAESSLAHQRGHVKPAHNRHDLPAGVELVA